MDVQLLNPGTHPFSEEWVWGLKASNGSNQKAVQAWRRLILAGRGRGEANIIEESYDTVNLGTVSANTQSNTTVICSQKISSGEFRVTVDGVA